MELLEHDLGQVLDNRGEGFNSEEIYKIISQLNNTFRIFEKYKIFHGDITLKNILLKYEDNQNQNFIVKLAGYYKDYIREMPPINHFYTRAPEVIEGEYKYHEKSDLWSIGIIIYKLYFREYPYRGPTQVSLLNDIIIYGRRKIKRTNEEKLDDLISKLLVYDPKKRITWEEYFNHPFFISI